MIGNGRSGFVWLQSYLGAEGGKFTLIADRSMAVAWYREYLKRYPRDVAALRGKDLACWCPMHAECHGDVLLKLANKQ